MTITDASAVAVNIPTPAMTSFFGLAGASICMILSCLGSAYGMSKAGVAVTSIGINHPEKIVKSLIPVVMAGMLGIYGVLIAIILITTKGIPFSPLLTYPSSLPVTLYDRIEFQGILWFCGSLAVGFTALASGVAIGLVGDSGATQIEALSLSLPSSLSSTLLFVCVCL
jgi:V-type H+-transporting ATPase proteolipid subunit